MLTERHNELWGGGYLWEPRGFPLSLWLMGGLWLGFPLHTCALLPVHTDLQLAVLVEGRAHIQYVQGWSHRAGAKLL